MDEQLQKNLPQAIGLIILVFILLFVSANFGYIRACEVPVFDQLYFSVKGYPQMAIVSNWDLDSPDSVAGIGNPEVLRSTIIDRTQQFPAQLYVEDILTSGVLDRYQLVIVERAKEIDTSTLQAFRDYVQKGGQLVWVGDAGTSLGTNDYVCQQVEFAYQPAANVTLGNATETQCGDWIYVTPHDPTNLENGLCGRTLSDVVLKFYNENKTLYQQVTTGSVFLCQSEESSPYEVKGAERLSECIADVAAAGEDLTAANINQICDQGVNYWNRGTTETETGKILPKFNFGSVILGLDYIGQIGTSGLTNLFLQPVDPTHPLIRGYTTRTDVTLFLGESGFSAVDTSGYSLRSSSIMNLKADDRTYPAIVASSPLGPLFSKKGLIVYYAFPPEIGATSGTGAGINLIDNMIQHSLCLS
jgi:hypothetical protein